MDKQNLLLIPTNLIKIVFRLEKWNSTKAIGSEGLKYKSTILNPDSGAFL